MISLSPPPFRDPMTSQTWVIWFQSVFNLLRRPVAGQTSARPASSLVVGQMFFDQTLGQPIWWDGAAWVDATGTPV